MSFDQYDYPALSRTPLFRYGYGQGGGLRKTNVLADMLNGLANGVQNFQAARQQSAQQDQANQTQALQRQLLQGQIDHQGLVNDQLRQSSEAALNAPYADAMDQANRMDPTMAADGGFDRAAAIRAGRYKIQPPTPGRVATDDAGLGQNATSVGTEGNIPGQPGNLFTGLNFDPTRATKEQQAQALRNLMIGKLTTEAPQYRNPASLMSAVSQLANGAQLGQAVSPGFQYSPADGSQPPATVGGFPTHVNPVLPPNTVDLSEAYRMAGPTRWEDQQAQAQRKVDQQEAGKDARATQMARVRTLGTILGYNTKLDTNVRQGLGTLLGQGAQDPDAVMNFLRANQTSLPPGAVDQYSQWINDPNPKALMPNPFGAPQPSTTGQGLFPNGTRAGAQIDLSQANARLAEARSGYYDMLAEKTPDRINAEIQHLQDMGVHWSNADDLAVWKAKADALSRDRGASQRDQQIAVANYNSALKAHAQDLAAATRDPAARQLTGQLMQLARQEASLRQNALERSSVDKKASQALMGEANAVHDKYTALQQQLQQARDTAAGGAMSPMPPPPQLQPTQSVLGQTGMPPSPGKYSVPPPQSGGVPALPAATAQNLGMAGPAAPPVTPQQALQSSIQRFQSMWHRMPTQFEQNQLARAVHQKLDR